MRDGSNARSSPRSQGSTQRAVRERLICSPSCELCSAHGSENNAYELEQLGLTVRARALDDAGRPCSTAPAAGRRRTRAVGDVAARCAQLRRGAARSFEQRFFTSATTAGLAVSLGSPRRDLRPPKPTRRLQRRRSTTCRPRHRGHELRRTAATSSRGVSATSAN